MSIAKELETPCDRGTGACVEDLQAHRLSGRHADDQGPAGEGVRRSAGDAARRSREREPRRSAITASAFGSARCCTSTRLPKTSARSCGRNRNIRSISPRRSARTCQASRSSIRRQVAQRRMSEFRISSRAHACRLPLRQAVMAHRQPHRARDARSRRLCYDLTQRKHAILRNFPIIGHLRYLLESVGPELRQYIVTSNQEERPFSRDQRRWVYASSKLQNNYFGFGTDAELENSPNHIVIKHAAFPIRSPYPGERDYDPTYPLPCTKVLGEIPSTPEGLPAAVSGQHLGNELRVAQRRGGRGVESRRGAGGLPAEHRRRRFVAASSARRRSGFSDRHRLLRLPRTRRPFQPGQICSSSPTSTRASAPSKSNSVRAPSPASAACCRARN